MNHVQRSRHVRTSTPSKAKKGLLQRTVFGRRTQVHVRERLWLYLGFLSLALAAITLLQRGAA